MTFLHVAAKKGECIEIVKKLIQKGADINIQDKNGVSEMDPANNTVSIVHIFCCLKNFISLQAMKVSLKTCHQKELCATFPVGCMDIRANINM